MIRALFLDLDGTLIDRVALWKRSLIGFFADRGLPLPEPDRVDWLLAYPTGTDWHSMADALWHLVPGLGDDRTAIGLALRDQVARSAVPDPTVNGLVDALSARYRTAIVTNGSTRVQRAKILGAGLAGRTGAEFISGRMGVRKPDPEFFRRVLAWAEVAPAEAMIVGDSPLEDIQGAQQAGLLTCAVGERYDESWPRPDYRIARFLDLPEVLG